MRMTCIYILSPRNPVHAFSYLHPLTPICPFPFPRFFCIPPPVHFPDQFELEQDNAFFDKDFGEMKSSKKKDEQNPVYGEDFNFNIPTLNNMELKVKVMDDDVGFDEELGSCKIKLEKLDLGPEPIDVKRKVDNNIFSPDAYVFLKLSYTE